MKYLMPIKHSESYRSQPLPQALLNAMGEFVAGALKSGVLRTQPDSRPPPRGFEIARAAAS
jgi:hypothetical protein